MYRYGSPGRGGPDPISVTSLPELHQLSGDGDEGDLCPPVDAVEARKSK